MFRRLIAALLCMTFLAGLSGCSKIQGAKPGSSAESAKPAETTAPTEPAPTTPADGNPNDVTCRGSYYVSDEEIIDAKEVVVGSMNGANLTNSELQLYYWLEVAAHRISDNPDQPDYSRSLDTQPCPIDDKVNSWQQYFLRKALSAWHAQKALVFMSRDEGVPVNDPEYKPDPEKRAEYMTGMPATKVLYQWSEAYRPNRLHQTYLDELPATLKAMAKDMGFENNNVLAKAIGGSGTDARDLISYAHTVNIAYMYFTEMGYYFEPTAEDIEAYYQENLSSGQEIQGKTANLRHILLIPEDAEVAENGTVSASEDAWANCEAEAISLVEKWQKEVKSTRYSQFATASIPEARFSEIAKDYSQDPGSRANGGLYSHVSKGQLMPELEEWCFSDAREHGDCEIIRSAAGLHIVFFSAFNENRRTEAANQLTHSLYGKLVAEAVSKYPATFDYSAIRLGETQDNGSFVTPSDLLYPDVAHERFPDMPLYLQQDYPDAPFGNYKLSTHGCGITTLAMVASYMADDELTPAELAARYGYYCGQRGSEIVLFDDTPAEMGFHLQGRSASWPEMNKALQNGQVVVSLQWFGYWTRGGHYLAMIGMTEDDRYVVRDSNLLNYKRILKHAEDSHSRGSIAEAGQYYWIYEPKVTFIPACVRCGGDAEGAPEVMFRSDYHCEKCLTATIRRDSFLNGLAG